MNTIKKKSPNFSPATISSFDPPETWSQIAAENLNHLFAALVCDIIVDDDWENKFPLTIRLDVAKERWDYQICAGVEFGVDEKRGPRVAFRNDKSPAAGFLDLLKPRRNVTVSVDDVHGALELIRDKIDMFGRYIFPGQYNRDSDIIELKLNGELGFVDGEETLVYLRQAAKIDRYGDLIMLIPEVFYRINADGTVDGFGEFGGEFLLKIGREINTGSQLPSND